MMTETRRPYVAYRRLTGEPWAASFDRKKIFDYAERRGLVVLDVDWLEEEEQDHCSARLYNRSIVHLCAASGEHQMHYSVTGFTWTSA